MFSLIANNSRVFLYPNTKLRFEVTSPLFTTGVITSAVVYPFDLPITGNELVFECAHFLEANRKYKTIPCSLYFSGILICSGELILSKIKSKNYRAKIIGNAFAISSKDKVIREIELPSEIIESDPYHPNVVSRYATEVVKEIIPSMFQFPKMWADAFYGSINEDGQSELNPDYGESLLKEIDGKFVNNYSGASVVFGFPFNEIREDPLPSNIFTLVPCPYLNTAFQKLVESQGYSVFGNFFHDTEIQRILISSNTPLDELHPSYFVRASNFIDVQYFDFSGRVEINNDTDPPNTDEQNCWNTQNSEYTIEEAGYHHIKFTCDFMIHVSQAMPYKKARIRMRVNEATADFVDQQTMEVETWVPGVFESTFWVPNEWVGLPIWFEAIFLETSNPNVAWYAQHGSLRNVCIEITNVSKNEYNDWSNVLSLSNHLPDITFSNFLNAVKDTFSLAIWIDNNGKEVQIGFTKDAINSPKYLDLTDNLISDTPEVEMQEPQGKEFKFNYSNEFQSTSGKDFTGPYATLSDIIAPDHLNVLALIENLNVIYHYTVDENNKPDWFYFADNLYPYVSGDNTQEVNVNLSPVVMHQKNATAEDDVICPKLLEVGNSSAYNPETIEMPFRIMLWLGMQENDYGYTYPMASCTGLNYKGERIISLDLNWSGQYGLIERYYKPILDLTENQEKTTINISINPIEMGDILYLFSPQKERIEKRKIRIGNKNYLPSKASFQLTQKGIDNAEIELISKNDR